MQRERMDRWAPWVIGNLFVLALFARDIVHFDDGIVTTQAFWGRDFINVWTSGHLLIEGKLDILYDVGAYHQYAQQLFGAIGQHNFSYPPLVLPLMAPFAMLPYPLALAVWTILTGALFVVAVRPWWARELGAPVWLAILTPAALVNIWAGHYGFLIGALFLFAWHALAEGRQVRAGVLIGLMVIKPHLAVLFPLVLAMRREWTAFFVAGATVISLIAVSAAIFGIPLWAEYLTVTTGVQASMIDAGESFFRYMTTSLATGLLQMDFPYALAIAVQTLLAVFAAVIVGIVAKRESAHDIMPLMATGTFLVLPYAFNYDLTVVAVCAFLLVVTRQLDGWEQRLAIGGFAAAQFGMVLSSLGLPGIPLLLIGLFVVQCRVLYQRDAFRSNGIQGPKATLSAQN